MGRTGRRPSPSGFEGPSGSNPGGSGGNPGESGGGFGGFGGGFGGSNPFGGGVGGSGVQNPFGGYSRNPSTGMPAITIYSPPGLDNSSGIFVLGTTGERKTL
jgi:hypothetical protein